MTITALGDWAIWFLMVAICFIVIIATYSLCTAGIAWYTTRLRGKPTLAFQFNEKGKSTMVYVYDHEHPGVRAVVDDLIARKPKVEDPEAQNGQRGASNDNLEGKSQV